MKATREAERKTILIWCCDHVNGMHQLLACAEWLLSATWLCNNPLNVDSSFDLMILELIHFASLVDLIAFNIFLSIFLHLKLIENNKNS